MIINKKEFSFTPDMIVPIMFWFLVFVSYIIAFLIDMACHISWPNKVLPYLITTIVVAAVCFYFKRKKYEDPSIGEDEG